MSTNPIQEFVKSILSLLPPSKTRLPDVRKSQKVMAFFDEPNIRRGLKDNNLDPFEPAPFYQKAYDKMNSMGISTAWVFCTDWNYENLRRIENELGFQRVMIRTNGKKDDVDQMMTWSIAKYAPMCDIVVIGSGDGGFAPIVHELKTCHHKRVIGYGIKNYVSKILQKTCDRYEYLL